MPRKEREIPPLATIWRVPDAVWHRLQRDPERAISEAKLGEASGRFNRWFQRWAADGVFEELWAALLLECDDLGKPERVIHDKGSAFWSWRGISRFTSLLTELGIDQIEAVHKEWNGKLEAFNGNLHTELFDVHRFFDVSEMRRKLGTHLHWYNHARTHHSLGGLLVPADRFYGRAAEVLVAIEAGAGRDLGDGLNLRDRVLELFKVTCKGGVTEVWLMGQPLLGAKPGP